MSDFDDDIALAIQLSIQDQRSRATSSKDAPIVIDSSDDEEITEVTKPTQLRGSASNSSKKIAAPRPTISKKKLPSKDKVLVLDTTIEIEDTDTATESESDDEPPAPKIAPTVSNKGKAPLLSVTCPTPGKSSTVASSNADPPSTANLSPMAAFRAERIKMEEERLARLKRRRPSPPPVENYLEEDEEEIEERPSKRPSPAHSSDSSTTPSNSYGGSFNVPDKSGLFWHGALRQTANKHVAPAQDKKPIFRLTSDILPPPSTAASTSSESRNALSFAIVSSFALDLPWLYQLFPPDVPVILVTQPGQDGRAEVHHALPGWVRASPKLEGGRGCMHVKLLLLFYKNGRLRVVIPTANFQPHDWRDIENSIWLQDIPLRTGSAPSTHPTTNSDPKTEGFAERLERVLKALNVEPALEAHITDQRASGDIRLPLRSLDELHSRWDWSRVTAHLVPSIAGKHAGWPTILGVGHVALMKAVRDMGAKNDDVSIECQGSSIGYYSPSWTNEFMSSAKGISPDAYLDTPKARRSKAPHPSGLKVVYPSLRTVDESVLGRYGAGTMFCQRKQWDTSTFPKNHFYDSNSKRGKVMMHSKMILGIPNEKEPTPGKPKAWLYIGSHNFTPSAWGTLSGSAFNPSIYIINYELGVVLPLESASQGDELACWQRPPRQYVSGQDVPWVSLFPRSPGTWIYRFYQMQNEHM
ncbi:tyrosyl-DNA phosphodiesterase [Rhizoctonia solani AG-3 Rhs1AP]|uniref:Tyrosyl-DNA phosphodiesterase n=1 Tax=Rhizoctonia solani AG-3 Rhs1AP TaxID=1086054 RepID=A0A0A1UJR5_9AGAM|nr:tyrosyl-DNA phosphodiesterase [Rhizoctonia solani AG-3 Rhs1AP]